MSLLMTYLGAVGCDGGGKGDLMMVDSAGINKVAEKAVMRGSNGRTLLRERVTTGD